MSSLILKITFEKATFKVHFDKNYEFVQLKSVFLNFAFVECLRFSFKEFHILIAENQS